MLKLPLRALVSAVTLVWSLTLGCSEPDRVSVYPVRGKVLYQGRPAAGAQIVFHATASVASPTVPIPRATVQVDGTFELTTYQSGDGAPEGRYDVSIVWRGTVDSSGDPESGPDQVDRLGGRYADPDTSGLSAEVRPEETQLEPFELK
jgi:hypothetical protein